jgi:hypothetical protein
MHCSAEVHGFDQCHGNSFMLVRLTYSKGAETTIVIG